MYINYLEVTISDVRTSSSSGIDFAIASTPTSQCVSDQSLTTAGNILFLVSCLFYTYTSI